MVAGGEANLWGLEDAGCGLGEINLLAAVKKVYRLLGCV